MNPILVLVLILAALVTVIGMISNARDKARRRQRMEQRNYYATPEPEQSASQALDPLDGSALERDNVIVKIKTSKGDVKMRVNRGNAKTLNVHGLTAFPYFRQTFSDPSVGDNRYYMSIGNMALDLIDHLFLYEFFFAGNDCVVYNDEGQEMSWNDDPVIEESTLDEGTTRRVDTVGYSFDDPDSSGSDDLGGDDDDGDFD